MASRLLVSILRSRLEKFLQPYADTLEDIHGQGGGWKSVNDVVSGGFGGNSFSGNSLTDSSKGGDFNSLSAKREFGKSPKRRSIFDYFSNNIAALDSGSDNDDDIRGGESGVSDDVFGSDELSARERNSVDFDDDEEEDFKRGSSRGYDVVNMRDNYLDNSFENFYKARSTLPAYPHSGAVMNYLKELEGEKEVVPPRNTNYMSKAEDGHESGGEEESDLPTLMDNDGDVRSTSKRGLARCIHGCMNNHRMNFIRCKSMCH